MVTPIQFAAPAPGHWTLDRSHYPGGTTPISQWLIEETMPAGLGQVFAELGAPVRRVDAAFVNGFMYTRIRPLVRADRPATRLPPAPILKLVTRFHPEFRRRAARAAATLRNPPGTRVADEWDREMRPRLRARNRAFQDVDPATLDDDALQHHVDGLLDHARQQFELHFWLHGHDLGPIARYLHAAIGWGLDPERAVDALAGASPSTARPTEQLHRLRQVIEASGRVVTTLDDVRAVSAEAAGLLDEYLDERGQIVATGYDLTAFTLAELPNLVLDSIRTATPPLEPDHASIAERLREAVPADEVARFDELLGDARAVMDMRDDNGPLTTEWPIGLLRRALLAAGTRLVARGRLVAADHLLETTPDEARRLFTDLPSGAELERRARERARLAALDPPLTLGPPEPEPALELLPPPLGELTSMIQVAFEHLGMDGGTSADPLSGVGIGSTPYTGRARVARSADDAIERLEPGDVLVVRATSPAFNAVLAIAGAVVTANGGAMSHAAVLARELGIPGVIGAVGALSIEDGSTIEVDPVAGTVRPVAPS